MAVTYKKATTIDQVIDYIRNLDVEYIRQNGTTLVLPFIDSQTRKIIKRELKRLKIYHKVEIVITDDVKAMYQKTLNTYKKTFPKNQFNNNIISFIISCCFII